MSTNEGWERYARQLPLIGEDGQRRLGDAAVVIAGAGGLGSPAAMYLAAAGIGRLILVDCDTVEMSNLNRQVLHWAGDAGTKKVNSAAEKIQRLNPAVELQCRDMKITPENAAHIIDEAAIVVDALDNFSSRFVLNDAALTKGIPLVHGAVRGFHGQVTTIIPGKTACLRCLYGSSPPGETAPVMGVTAGITGLMQANEVIKYLTGRGSLLLDRLMIWEGGTGSTMDIAITRNPSCRCNDLGAPADHRAEDDAG